MKQVNNFSLFQRNKKWYARFKASDGKLIARSVDKLAESIGWDGTKPITKRNIANQICSMAMANGINDTSATRGLTCEKYLMDWWDWNGDRIRRKNTLNPNSISEHYASIMSLNIRRHVVPSLPKNIPLSSITPNHVKTISDTLADRNTVARGTMVKIMQAVMAPLKFAWKQGLIEEDPTRLIESINSSGKKRGAPTQAEFNLLLSQLEKRAHRTGDRHTLMAVKLAATTGMRLGEIIALGKSSIILGPDASRIVICRAWSVMGGFKTPKGKRSRETYIPTSLANQLIELCDRNPDISKIKKGVDPLIFWSLAGKIDTPVSEKYIREHFYHCLDLALCDETGVKYNRTADRIRKGKGIREEKGLCFHSLRHFYISRAGSTLGDEALLRLVVGHENEAMTDRYTHIDQQKAMPLIAISNEILGE